MFNFESFTLPVEHIYEYVKMDILVHWYSFKNKGFIKSLNISNIRMNISYFKNDLYYKREGHF